METINPHDKFFKEAFSRKEKAGDLIKNVLPEGLSRNIDVGTLQLDSSSYIDEELSKSFSDLVYNCKYKGKAKIKISFLIEHKSFEADCPHLQLLKYYQKIWEASLKQKKGFIERKLEVKKDAIVGLYIDAEFSIEQIAIGLEVDKSFVESTLLEHRLLKKV